MMSKEWDEQNLCPKCGDLLKVHDSGEHYCPYCGWQEGDE